jgi:glutaredoxin-related protein
MFYCVLCEKETCYFSRFCDKCRRIKHYLNLYDARVYEVLDNVLSRNDKKQQLKIADEIKEEIKQKEYNLRSKKDHGDETYIKKEQK